MPYDPCSETLEEMRKRLAREEAIREKCPTPEEIAERARAIRAARVDENGVSVISPCNKGDGRKQREYRPGIRVVPAGTHRKAGLTGSTG